MFSVRFRRSLSFTKDRFGSDSDGLS